MRENNLFAESTRLSGLSVVMRVIRGRKVRILFKKNRETISIVSLFLNSNGMIAVTTGSAAVIGLAIECVGIGSIFTAGTRAWRSWSRSSAEQGCQGVYGIGDVQAAIVI